jgi:hypothetical protein
VRLGRVERRDLFLADLGRVNPCRRVERHQVKPDGLLQCAVQHRVDVADARGLEPVAQLGGVKGLDVGGCQL